MDEKTTIQVSVETRDYLARFKKHEREPLGEVLERFVQAEEEDRRARWPRFSHLIFTTPERPRIPVLFWDDLNFWLCPCRPREPWALQGWEHFQRWAF